MTRMDFWFARRRRRTCRRCRRSCAGCRQAAGRQRFFVPVAELPPMLTQALGTADPLHHFLIAQPGGADDAVTRSWPSRSTRAPHCPLAIATWRWWWPMHGRAGTRPHGSCCGCSTDARGKACTWPSARSCGTTARCSRWRAVPASTCSATRTMRRWCGSAAPCRRTRCPRDARGRLTASGHRRQARAAFSDRRVLQQDLQRGCAPPSGRSACAAACARRSGAGPPC